MAHTPDLYPSKSNEESLRTIINIFSSKIKINDLVYSPDGDVTAEILGSVIRFDPYQAELNFGNIRKTNTEYVKKELEWYLSEKLNIHPIMDDVAVWNKVCNKSGEICSNYGWAIFSEQNNKQYEHCLARLINNPFTKRAVMIYTRPSMWEDSKKDGMNDFMCTDGVQCHIVNNRLIYMVKQRSCDFVYGLFNDLAWHQWVYKKLIEDLSNHCLIKEGVILFYPFNLHVYAKHFELIHRLNTYVNACQGEKDA